ncbi:helix-turn-helix domain-containing protein [Geodermatophilus sp. SYSU D01180]
MERYVVDQYAAGRSLRELAELTDRSFSAVRKILDRHGVRRRGVGAARLTAEPPPPSLR